jgi:D-hydroxyproline dehydrogenase subunit gamma
MRTVKLTIDGVLHTAPVGATVGVVLHAARKPLRSSPRAHQPRGLYCGMGICFECTVRVNGVSDVRACMTTVAEGMIVETLG